MLIRLVTAPADAPLLLRQSPGARGAWGDFVFSTSATRCDACVVYEGFARAFEVRCPPDKTLFFAAEPPAVRGYDAGFLAQFHRVVSCHQLPHPRVSLQQPALPWHLGMRNSPLPHLPNYDDFRALSWDDKPLLLSVICSNKAFTPGHRQRLEWVRALQEILGDQLHFYGRGLREIEDKWQAIVPYRYHIALENSRVAHYWTEKLSDAFLGGAHPFYLGAPNIGDYFGAGALTLLPLESPAEAAQIIRACLARDADKTSFAARRDARDGVLNRHNFLEVASQILSGPAQTPARTLRFVPEPAPKAPLSQRAKMRLKRLLKI